MEIQEILIDIGNAATFYVHLCTGTGRASYGFMTIYFLLYCSSKNQELNFRWIL